MFTNSSLVTLDIFWSYWYLLSTTRVCFFLKVFRGLKGFRIEYVKQYCLFCGLLDLLKLLQHNITMCDLYF